MTYRLVSHLAPGISIFADEWNYILLTKENGIGAKKNGHRQYFGTIADCFQAIWDFKVKTALADNQDKTLEDILKILKATREEMRELMKPFESPTQ
jgi:hypothetical protein